MAGTHEYRVGIEWLGNRGTGTSGFREYGRQLVVRAGDGRELAAAIASLAARRRSPAVPKPGEEPTWALLASRRALVAPGGQRIEFTAKEWQFLSLVVERGGECATRESLRLALYGRDDVSADHGLETLVRRTRQKIADALGPDGPGPILTDYGVGYRFGGRTIRRDS